ncbi:sugar ABC transporter permease [Alicyclobacillus cellulosilyticus]|uniref:Sugar ABC transporter permease n=1 Tax=Alicyclobacillus cellulosilyticus TaxID=1003997 RepID=A0A917K4C9_9BACL|nr:carbohydrate ABC transporter permease [Alicyclobacillus cellulosilyticus]GGJ00595.1 sugar ABC transporter permease [Alicyclobacillus cellulosilyticus]
MSAVSAGTAVPVRRKRMPVAQRVYRVFIYALLTALSALFLVPLFWMVSSALKSSSEVFVFPPVWWPKHPEWGNFKQALTTLPFGLYALNTLLIAVVNVVGNVVSCSLVAYGFARFRFPGRRILFMLLLSTMMIPSQVLLVPQFIMYHDLGWINTFLPLTVPAFFGSAFYVFLLRQFFMTIPPELEEAARIDGAGTFRIFTTIVLPQIKPALTAVAIFSFQGAWNDFLSPLLYLNDQAKYTLQLGLTQFQGSFHTDWNLIMAASVVVILPMLIIFFLGQRYFVQGITMTGTKG